MSDLVFPLAIPTVAVKGGGRFPVRRIWCVGRNYAAHAREMGADLKEPPFFFSKQPDMAVPDGTVIAYPSLTTNFQQEVELVVALKSGGTDIAPQDALSHVFGYAVGLDMTRRDLQGEAKKKGFPWDAGKSFEQSAPCGVLTRADAAGDKTAGRIAVSVNGVVRQDSDLSDMIWNVAGIISKLSGQVAVGAGDLIYTGTPEGVGALARGDRVVAQIDGLESLTVTIA